MVFNFTQPLREILPTNLIDDEKTEQENLNSNFSSVESTEYEYAEIFSNKTENLSDTKLNYTFDYILNNETNYDIEINGTNKFDATNETDPQILNYTFENLQTNETLFDDLLINDTNSFSVLETNDHSEFNYTSEKFDQNENFNYSVTGSDSIHLMENLTEFENFTTLFDSINGLLVNDQNETSISPKYLILVILSITNLRQQNN